MVQRSEIMEEWSDIQLVEITQEDIDASPLSQFTHTAALPFTDETAGDLAARLRSTDGPVFAGRVRWRGERREQTRRRSVTDEQQSQRVVPAKTLRAAASLATCGVGSVLTAHRGMRGLRRLAGRQNSSPQGHLYFFNGLLRARLGSPRSDGSHVLRQAMTSCRTRGHSSGPINR